MPQLIQSPPQVSLAANPVLFGIKTSNQYQSAGTKAQFVLMFSGYPNIGEYFELSYNGIDHYFEFVATPGVEPWHLPASYTGVGFGTFTLYLLQIVTELNRHYHFSTDYNISLVGLPGNPMIFFEAKVPGSIYTLEFNQLAGVVSTDPSSNVAGVDPVPRPFYSVYLQTYINNLIAGEDILTPDEAGDVYHNISAYLKAHSKSSFIWPGTSIMQNRTDLMLQFYIRYAERWGLPAEIKKLKASSFALYSLPGGVGFRQQAMYQQQNNSWYSTLQYTRQFLTWQPRVKTIKPDQIEKLFWLNNQPHTQLQLRGKVTFFPKGAPATSVTGLIAGVNTAQWNIVEITFGYNLLNFFNIDPNKTVQKYEIWLTDDAGNPVSDTRTYILDHRGEIHAHHFIWRNSFGMYDTEVFTGRYEKSVASEKQIYTFTNRFRFEATDPSTQVLQATEVEMVNASTGWIDDEERANWLREMLLSPEVYEVIDGVLHPIVITSGDVHIHTAGKTLHNIAVEFTRAYTDEHFSKGGFVTATFLNSYTNGFMPSLSPVITP